MGNLTAFDVEVFVLRANPRDDRCADPALTITAMAIAGISRGAVNSVAHCATQASAFKVFRFFQVFTPLLFYFRF